MHVVVEFRGRKGMLSIQMLAIRDDHRSLNLARR
jgi:hypothetical protein